MRDIIYKHGNLTLDDWVKNEDPDLNGYWTQLCPEHSKQVTEKNQLDDVGYGICGVKGCWRESEHYLDFDNDDFYGKTI